MERWCIPWVFLTAELMAGSAFSASAVEMEKGQHMFLQGTKPACALCHTLQDAGAAGEIGPNLDELKPDADRVTKAIREGLGVMPAFPDLSDEEVRMLADYVEAATK